MLLTGDTDDEYLATARAIVTLMPSAVLVPMREVSHWPPFEKPEEFNRLAMEFLGTARPGSDGP